MVETGVIGVVLCDDVPQLRMLLRFALEDDDSIEVLGEAGDGAEGVQLVTELRPSVVIVDLAMPGMDGLEAIPMMRAASPDTAILVFSGFVSDGIADQVIALGADRYLEKGSDMDLVAQTVIELGRAA